MKEEANVCKNVKYLVRVQAENYLTIFSISVRLIHLTNDAADDGDDDDDKKNASRLLDFVYSNISFITHERNLHSKDC